MREVVTDAFVLGVDEGNDLDRRVDLYADGIGRVAARVVGGRRIQSKLAPHLDLGAFATVRLVQKNRTTVTDALCSGRLSAGFLRSLFFVNSLSPEFIFDKDIWDLLAAGLSGGAASYKMFLKCLGYDVFYARCAMCQGSRVSCFVMADHVFACRDCGERVPEEGVVEVSN